MLYIMTIVSSGQISITDLNDATQLILYLNANAKTQVYNPNATGSTAYTPDFTSAYLVVTPELYVAGGGSSNLLPSSQVVSVTWYEGSNTSGTPITDGATSTGADGVSSYTIPTGSVTTTSKTLTCKTNFTAKNSQKFTCVVVYHDNNLNSNISMKADVEIVKITNGVKGADGTGTNATVGVLSNENVTVPANSSGTPTDLTQAVSTLTIYSGTTDVTSSFNIALTLNPANTTNFNVSTSGTNTNQTVTVSTMVSSVSSASVTFTATPKTPNTNNYPVITKIFNVSKLNAGGDGTSPTISWINMPTTLNVNNTGTYATSTVVIKALSQTGNLAQANFNGYIQVDTSVDGNAWTNRVANTTAISNGSYTYPSTGSIPSGIKFIKVQIFSASGGSGLLDSETCAIVSDGNDTFFLNVFTPNGDMIRNSSGSLTIQADMYKGNSNINGSITSYKWYYQDATATTSNGGDIDGTAGWRLLQSFSDPASALTASNFNTSTAGGTLTGGTYFVRYSWLTTNGETKASPVMGTGIAVTANYNLKITLPTAPAPTSQITGAKIYVGTVSGSEKYQGTVTTNLTTGGIYTITAPIATGSAGVPASNTATYTNTTSGFTSNVLTVPNTAINSYAGYKCIAVYNSTNYQGVSMVKDITDPILCRIDGTNVFKNGAGTNSYTATLLQAGTEIDHAGSTYTYTWSMYNQDGTQVGGFSKTGKTITVSATDITNIGNLICSVSK